MATLLVTGADLLGSGAQDLLVEDGRIIEVGSIRSAKGADVLDADGLVALPGLVDLHTHLREPGREDAETIASGVGCGGGGRLHRDPRDGQHQPRHRHRRGGRAHPRPRPRDRAGRRRPGRRGHQGARRVRSWPSSG